MPRATAACPAALSCPCYSKAYARASSLLLLTRARHLSLFCSLSSSPCVQNDMPLPWLPEAPAPPLFLPLQSSSTCSDLVLPTPTTKRTCCASPSSTARCRTWQSPSRYALMPWPSWAESLWSSCVPWPAVWAPPGVCARPQHRHSPLAPPQPAGAVSPAAPCSTIVRMKMKDVALK